MMMSMLNGACLNSPQVSLSISPSLPPSLSLSIYRYSLQRFFHLRGFFAFLQKSGNWGLKAQRIYRILEASNKERGRKRKKYRKKKKKNRTWRQNLRH
uniref:Uncharacterized protein n=1 Tax=Rhizophora mucronata TaxID=61149 RepID=A0A2P2Q2L0_RHIMU